MTGYLTLKNNILEMIELFSKNKVILPLEGDRLCCRISCERVPEKLF